jgi:thioredoxin reductase (NADPH)
MKGDKFVWITPDIRTWYDGKTQWTYLVHADEVNLTTPTGDDLQSVNPMALLNTYKTGFNLTYLGESTADSGKSAHDIRLSSKPGSDVEKIELQIEKIRCLIIGSGPAGYTAAIYASRANLHPVLYEGIQPGGQLTTTTEVENYPGYPQGVSGFEMMEDLKKQAARFGADIRSGIATSTDLSGTPCKVVIDEVKTIETEALIIATGATAKYLGLADEQKYAGMGVSACATCDGFFYRKKTVAVAGGGDTACEEALYLSGLAAQVYLIVRKPFLRASQIMRERVLQTPNITVLFEHNAIGLFGEGGVEGVHLVKRLGQPDEEKVDIAIDGFFLSIGHAPNSAVFKPWVDTDDAGYIVTKPGTPFTNLPGVFAAGDVADPVYRQAVTAAAAGCKAAIEAEKYLSSIKK